MIGIIVSLALAYLIGSIPTSYIFTKLLKKIDIRQHGSGNVGATNVFRVVGKGPAAAVLVLDILKGVVAVALIPILFQSVRISFGGAELYGILLGVSVIAGHVWSAFLKFQGGKGVATTAGVLIVLAPKVVIASVIIWVFVFALSRIVSVASIASSLLLPVWAALFLRSPRIVLFCALLSLAGIYKHKSNIRRLMKGQEKKLF